MDYKDFTNRTRAYNGFVFYRKEVLDSVEIGDFNVIFTELCTRALSGDPIAQDVTAYFFNKGVPGFLKPNFDYYMRWQILAGANGNCFALEKLEFFLNSALNELVYNEEFLKQAMRKRNINADNALYVISNLLCEGIVDELKINPKDLIKINDQESLYSSAKNRVYLDALDKCVEKVAMFLLS